MLGDTFDDLEPREKMRTKTLIIKSAKRPPKHCPTGKTVHPTKKRALSSAHTVVRFGHAELIRVYKCPTCHNYHLTSQVERKKKRA